MNYYEINLKSEDDADSVWICIKGVRQPSIDEASEFLKGDVKKFGPVLHVYPIDEITARGCYDFRNEPNWPVFGI